MYRAVSVNSTSGSYDLAVLGWRNGDKLMAGHIRDTATCRLPMAIGASREIREYLDGGT